jgi:DNA polymerase IIIc chi subunit
MISALLYKLKTSFDLAVCKDPMATRMADTPAPSGLKILVTGASHAGQLADQLAGMAHTSAVTHRGWGAGKTYAAAVTATLAGRNCYMQ